MHHLELSSERTFPLGFVPPSPLRGKFNIDCGEAAHDPPSILLTIAPVLL